MFYTNWEILYQKISEDLELDIKNEIKSAKIFNEILKNNKNKIILESDLKNIFFKKEVFIFGAGPSLEKTIKSYKDRFENKILISADGATSALIKEKIYPDIIVTDLDGKVSDQINSNIKKSIVIIHAHGDNINNIKRYTKKFEKNIFGTIQINPLKYKFLNNYGGFTDGDRAVFLAEHFQAKYIYLLGFDFDGNIGRYSFSENKNVFLKRKKLKWCKYLIDYLIDNNNCIKYLKP